MNQEVKNISSAEKKPLKKKTIIIAVVCVLLAVVLAVGVVLTVRYLDRHGKEEDLIGYWYSSDWIFEFVNDNGTYRFEGFYAAGGSYSGGTYEAGNRYLTITSTGKTSGDELRYVFTEKGELVLFEAGKSIPFATLNKRKS